MLTIIALTICTIGLAFFFIGKNKIFKLCNAAQIRPHSLSIYHGSFPAVLATAPALIVLSLWVGADDLLYNRMLIAQFPTSLEVEGRQTILILLAQIHNIAEGIVVGQPEAWILSSAEKLTAWRGRLTRWCPLWRWGFRWQAAFMGYPALPLNSAPVTLLKCCCWRAWVSARSLQSSQPSALCFL